MEERLQAIESKLDALEEQAAKTREMIRDVWLRMIGLAAFGLLLFVIGFEGGRSFR